MSDARHEVKLFVVSYSTKRKCSVIRLQINRHKKIQIADVEQELTKKRVKAEINRFFDGTVAWPSTVRDRIATEDGRYFLVLPSKTSVNSAKEPDDAPEQGSEAGKAGEQTTTGRKRQKTVIPTRTEIDRDPVSLYLQFVQNNAKGCSNFTQTIGNVTGTSGLKQNDLSALLNVAAELMRPRPSGVASSPPDDAQRTRARAAIQSVVDQHGSKKYSYAELVLKAAVYYRQMKESEELRDELKAMSVKIDRLISGMDRQSGTLHAE